VLAAVRWPAVMLGLGAGGLTATVVALVAWPLLQLAGVGGAGQAGLTLGIVTGFIAGGFVAGRMAPTAHRFHGSLAGLALAGLVLVVARLGGSPAPTPQVLWLALLALVVAGLGGVLGGRGRKEAGS
jgi:putative membrane protein (TIGR04086 family)